MPELIKPRRARILVAFLIVAVGVAWFYWNRPVRADMAAYAPADCLAFVEAGDLAEVAEGLERTEAWRSLAGPIGAKTHFSPNGWLIRLPRWPWIVYSHPLFFSPSHFAVVFT